MSHGSYVIFVGRSLVDVGSSDGGLRALEVGSYDLNGGFRAFTDLHGGFSEYVGVDIREGPGIDIVCGAENIVEYFGEGTFDVVIATELLEHVRDWRKVVSNLKNVCRPGGTIIVTTRSRGYRYHAAPYDLWRFEVEDMGSIFDDLELLEVEKDSEEPGVFMKGRRPLEFREKDLADIALHCMCTGRRELDLNLTRAGKARLLLTIVSAKFRQFISILFGPSRKDIRGALKLQVNEVANLLAMFRNRGPSRF